MVALAMYALVCAAIILIAGAVSAAKTNRECRRLRAERRRLEYVLRRYNDTFNDNYDYDDCEW